MILANPQQLLKGLQATFIEALMAPRKKVRESIATYVRSESDQEDYAWLGEVQQVVEWTGELETHALTETSGRGFNAVNLEFAGGLDIKLTDLEDEKTGGLHQRVQDLAVRADTHEDEQCVAVLTGNPDGYDGVALFHDTHPARANSGAQDNIMTQSGTSTSQVQADSNDAMAYLCNVKDEAGLPANRGFRQLFVMYPPAINKAMREAFTADFISQTQNVQFTDDDIELIREPLLTATDAGDWYMGIKDFPVRGVLYQERKPVTFMALEGGSDNAFFRHVYSYQATKRSVAKAGLFRRITKVA